MSGQSALRPNDDDHSLAEELDRDNANLAIVEPVVLLLDPPTGKDLRSIDKIEPSLLQRLFPLGRIEGDFHVVYIAPKSIDVYTLMPHCGSAGFSVNTLTIPRDHPAHGSSKRRR